MITVGELFARFPYITWRSPIPIRFDGADYLGCRICVAQVGLRGDQVNQLSRTADEFATHMRTAHQLEPRSPRPVPVTEVEIWGDLDRERQPS